MVDNNSNSNTNNNNNTTNKKNINVRFPQLRLDKNVGIILGLVLVAAIAISINVAQLFTSQTNIVNQNDRIISEIDNNTALVKHAMKDIGNASLQKEAAYLIKQNSVEMSELKALLNDTHAKLDKLILK